MEWIRLEEGQKVPEKCIYTIEQSDPYTLNKNNGKAMYRTSFDCRYLEMYERVVAYMELPEPYIPGDTDH